MKKIRKISIIGSGNLAESLAQAIAESDLELVQIIARNPQRGAEVARLSHSSWCARKEDLLPSDLYILSVSDRSVRDAALWMPLPQDAIIAHTAGSVELNTLPDIYPHRAVFYPLQTFTKGRKVDFHKIPIFLETSSEEVRQQMEEFAEHLSPTHYYATTEMRTQIHMAGVWACNFTNYMYSVGERIVEKAGVGFDVLKPLIEETASKACDAKSPTQVQTGPAIRHDLSTQERHHALLAEEQEMKEIYQKISQNIWETSKKI